ncbi:MAG TPA: Rieske 2Fe-2S domain-containing protein [Candidatus Polarisedimenticolia bacterium]|nr:Rieske 2Fe-2S domain-containing protein [Candidatus Polarisedimenticolia bacterium]
MNGAPPGQSRRGFLSWFLGTSIGAMCASILYPVARYISPPDVPEAQTSRVVAGRAGDLKANEGRIFRFGNQPGLLIRTEDGGYRALSATCTHLNCTVQYRSDLKQIWCACHNGMYDLSGKNVSGPPPRPLEQYTVNVADGDIVVSKA